MTAFLNTAGDRWNSWIPAFVPAAHRPSRFFLDASRGIAHGKVTFAIRPVTIEAAVSQNPRSNLPTRAVPPNDLSLQYLRKRQR